MARNMYILQTAREQITNLRILLKRSLVFAGDYHGHMEHTAGQLTKGEYKVKLPDGRVQVSSDWSRAGRNTRL